MEIKEKVQEAIDGFKLPGELKECVVYGNGHINDTYRLTYETPNGTKRYILQRMSRSIFGFAKRSSQMAEIRRERRLRS